MGDSSSKKDPTNSNTSNKNRRSRSELIRMALGVYLKHRNYVATDKFRKSDLCLSQTPKQFAFNKMIDEDISNSNSFLFSNVLCLNNNHATVEQQFTKFVEFVEKQKDPIKNELSNLYGPLICHLYIELLKGREWKPAWNFLRNNAHYVAPVENLNAPLPNKVNGCSISSNSHEETASFPTATTQIVFSSESTENPHRDHFRDLIQSLSTCLRIESCDSNESIGLFRSSKYELEISLEAVNILKQYLSKHGHVLVLNILQTWIYFDITDIKGEDGKSMFSLQDDAEEKAEVSSDKDTSKRNIKQEVDATEKKVNSSSDKEPDHESIKIEDDNDPGEGTSTGIKRPHSYLRRLKETVSKLQKLEDPIRNVKITDPEQILSCATMDQLECHVVAGFNDTTIKLYQLNKRTIPGRHFYKLFKENLCGWNVSNLPLDVESSSDDEQNPILNPLRSTPYSYKAIRKKEFYERKCDENSFDDNGAVTLRGHSRGVTDVLFSTHHPLMYSTSKDSTMRAWKADNYACGAIYRGHNYPIWCVAESSIPNYIATGSRDFTARLWTADREHPLITYVGHTQDVECIAFHPNGNYLATGSSDLSVRLWNTTDGKVLRVFADCRYPVTCIAFSPNGKLLAAAGEETKIRIFDLAAGSQLAELRDHSAYVSSIAWDSTSNKFASSCVDGSVRVWDVSKLTSSDSPSQSSSVSSADRVIWHMSGCKRCVKILFHSGRVTTIGGV